MDTLATSRDYLVRSQRPDGSWGDGDPFVCARALNALHDAIPEDTLVRGLKYMEGRQEQDGHFAPVTKMYSVATSTAYSLVVLNRFDYGKASLPVSKGILWLLENQNEDGSWGTNKKKKAYTTTFCLRALHTFYLSGINRFSKGLAFTLDYLESMDMADEPVSHVYAPILNLKRVGYLEKPLEERFLRYAVDSAKVAIDAGCTADAAYLLGALNVLGESEISPAIMEWLEAARNEDGGYGKDKGATSDPSWTALAVLAMNGQL